MESLAKESRRRRGNVRVRSKRRIREALTVTLDTSTMEFGFNTRPNEWEKKDADVDSFFTVVGDKAEIWLKSGNSTV